MPDIKLIALDMDGTLLTHEHEVTESVKSAIKQALEKDIHVVLSTGRGFITCYPYAESLKLESYLITANGGQIWTVEKELLKQHLLETEKIEKMWEIGESLQLDMWMISTERVFRAERPENFYDYEWLKFGCNSFDEATLDKMVKELSFMDGLEMTNSLPTNIEVNPQGVSKAKALQFVCSEIGIEMENVLAVGDSLNDMKMIQEAGVGVAMGNAQEAIKKAADFITDTNELDGVAKAIEKFAL
ncbi:Cof-type HAD-IIB family hydrolase [Virgibacillus xinjiangensis]|uniref:Cof-type HAD-IIB family hydrolase n=1 Tax=Virgibacillus xinjiangensis TaxID=393090 RepID=A0ABV7CYF5_9BACI